MMAQQQLYLWNRQRLQDVRGGSPELLDVERAWIAARTAECRGGELPRTLAELRDRLAAMIADEAAAPSAAARFVAEEMSREQFRVLVQEFAIDGLTEAQAFYYVLPRLTLEAQMPMLRIMIDEFGSGNLKRAHTSLYVTLLRELEMPVELSYYCERICSECFEFVNLFFWLSLRADDPSYFAGAITYLETAIPAFFQCYVDACDRLGIAAHAYYSEHQHIDAFHALEGQRLLRAMDATNTLHVGKAWRGAQLASLVTGLAFEAAVAKARSPLDERHGQCDAARGSGRAGA
jgi:Iron-containing redox enzyme